MSEQFMYSRNSPEGIEAFVKTEWGEYQVPFTLCQSLDEQIDFLKNLLRKTKLDEFDDDEFRDAFQQHLIKLLGVARRIHHRLQESGHKTGSAKQDEPSPSSQQTPLQAYRQLIVDLLVKDWKAHNGWPHMLNRRIWKTLKELKGAMPDHPTIQRIDDDTATFLDDSGGLLVHRMGRFLVAGSPQPETFCKRETESKLSPN
jgi:hypothetical protein